MTCDLRTRCFETNIEACRQAGDALSLPRCHHPPTRRRRRPRRASFTRGPSSHRRGKPPRAHRLCGLHPSAGASVASTALHLSNLEERRSLEKLGETDLISIFGRET